MNINNEKTKPEKRLIFFSGFFIFSQS